VTEDGLVEYSLQIPSSAIRRTTAGGGGGGAGESYGSDIDWILAGRLLRGDIANTGFE
jgi:hypothetical protein